MTKTDSPNIPNKLSPNVNGDLELDAETAELGERMFQTFLLAGERHVTAKAARPGAEEARFAALYRALPVEGQQALDGYFRRQATLPPAERAQVLGRLASLRPTDSLSFADVAPDLLGKTAVQQVLQVGRQAAEAARSGGTSPGAAQGGASSDVVAGGAATKLRLMLTRLTVEDSQDATTVLGVTVNPSDETSLGVVAIDETGDVKASTHTLNSLKAGQSQTFGGAGLKLFGFSMTEGTTFPKAYSVTVYAIERDDGKYNALVNEAAAYAKTKVTEEMIAQGINIYTGATLPPVVVQFVSKLLKKFFDKLLDWFASLLKNKDDVLGQKTRTATIHSYAGNWSSSGTQNSAPWDWVFSGQGGRWRTTMHWAKVP